MSNIDDRVYSENRYKQSLGGTTLWFILITLFVMSTMAIALPFVIEPNKGERGERGERGLPGAVTGGADGKDGKSGILIENSATLYPNYPVRFTFVSTEKNDITEPTDFEGFYLEKGKLTIWPDKGSADDVVQMEEVWERGDFFRADKGTNIKGIYFQISDVDHYDAVPDGDPARTVLTLLHEPELEDNMFGNPNDASEMSRLRFVDPDPVLE